MKRNCDLEELKLFQQRNMVIFQEMLAISKSMTDSVEEASGLLQDDVSGKNLDKIRNLAQELQNMAQHGYDHMEHQLSKTQADLDAWDALR